MVKEVNEKDGKVGSVMLVDIKIGEECEFGVDGVFIYVGMVLLIKLFESLNIMNKEGYIEMNE